MRRFILLSVLLLLVAALFLSRPSSAVLEFNPGATPEDSQRLRELIAKCEGELQSFRELMDAIRRSSQPVRVFPGRNQPGVFIDGFGSGRIDLADLEKYANPTKDRETGKWIFPPGADPEAATLCENLAHVLYERFHANYVGGQYRPSHRAANDYESRIRKEFGQTGRLIDCVGDGRTDDAISVYVNDSFIIERDQITVQPNGSRDVGPITTTKVKVVCTAVCIGPPRRRLLTGADTCADCERDLATQCGGPMDAVGCRTK